MTAVIVAPSLRLERVSIQGIFNVFAEDATVACMCPLPCSGIDHRHIPLQYRSFDLLVQDMARDFIKEQRARGVEWLGDFDLHGPFQSFDFEKFLLDINDTDIAGKRDRDGFEHPEIAAGKVIDLNAPSPYVKYVLQGYFMKRASLVEYEA